MLLSSELPGYPREVPFYSKTVHLHHLNTMVEIKHTAARHKDLLEWWKWDSMGTAWEKPVSKNVVNATVKTANMEGRR